MINQNQYQKPRFNPPVQKDFSGIKSQVVRIPGNADTIRITSLGGFGEVNQNMFVYEYAPNGDFAKSQIIIVDCGVGFPKEDELGVDLQIPDITYLNDKKDRILGMFITHPHEDHIGAVRFIAPLLGKNLEIYAPRLASALISSRLVENGITVNLITYNSGDVIQKGPFTIEAIRVTHSVPDTHHFAITTPIGIIYHGSDFKFDLFPLDGKFSDINRIAAIGNTGKVIALLSDSLGVDHAGWSPSETIIAQNIKDEIASAKGRVFMTAISSNVVRWSQAIQYAKETGRKICTVGFSVSKVISIAKELGYINLADSDLVPPERVKNFADNKIIFLVGGFAGQANSSLTRMAMGKHRIKIKPGDKVIFSSPDYIPGTTTDIENMIDMLSKIGATVVSGEKEEYHVSGHAYQKEYALLINLVKPKFLLPIGGNYRHVQKYFEMAKDMGYSPDKFINPDHDSAVTFCNGAFDTNTHVQLNNVLIDGLGIGDVGVTVLRDRRILAEEGMFTIIMLVNKTTGEMFKDPVILSRGFVFVKENTDLLEYLRREVINKFAEVTTKPANFEYIRAQIQAAIETSIMNKTGRQPMVLPLVIEV